MKTILKTFDLIRRFLGKKCHDCRAHSHCNDCGCIRSDKSNEKQWWMKY